MFYFYFQCFSNPVIVVSFLPVVKWNMATAITDQKITFEMGLRGITYTEMREGPMFIKP